MNAGEIPPSELPDTDDPYVLLGIDETADERAIKRAYVGLIRRFRPEDAPEAFKRIRAAFEQATRLATRSEMPSPHGAQPHVRDLVSSPRPSDAHPHDAAPHPRPSSPRPSAPLDVVSSPPRADAHPLDAAPHPRTSSPPRADAHPLDAAPHPRTSSPDGPHLVSREAPPWPSAVTTRRALQAMIVDDDAAALWAWLEGAPLVGLEPAAQADPSNVMLALGFMAWSDAERALRAHGVLMGLRSVEPDVNERWLQTLEATRALAAIPTLRREAPALLRALRCADAMAYGGPVVDLAPLHQDAVARLSFYAALLDRIEQSHPVLMPPIERLVSHAGTAPGEPHPAMYPYVLHGLESASLSVDNDPLRGLAIAGGIFTILAGIVAAFQIGWWAVLIPTVTLTIVGGVVYFYLEALTWRTYRKRMRPWLLQVAATTGAGCHAIAHVFEQESDPDDAEAREFVLEVLAEDYAIEWFAALCRARQGA